MSTKRVLRSDTASNQLKMLPGPNYKGGVFVRKRLAVDEEQLLGRKVAKLSPLVLPILPTEMISEVLNFVKDPKDLKNCAAGAPLLDNLLTPRKPVFLFSGVIRHVADYLFPQDIANCRLVCREWLQSLNKMAERLPAKRPYDDDFYQKQMRSQRTRLNGGASNYSLLDPSVFLDCTRGNLENFNDAYDACYSTARNPFFGRSVTFLLNFTTVAEAEDLVQHLQQFLSKFGRYIWYVTVKVVVHQNISQLLVCNFLPNFLRLCRNLRSFNLTVSGPPLEENRQVIRQLVRRSMSMMGNFDCINLPHLESLELLQNTGVPQVLSGIVIPFLRQVQKLTVTQWRDEYLSGCAHLPNLKELNILFVSSNRELEKLENISACHLRRFSVSFRYPKVDGQILLRILRKFHTLSMVDIDWLLDQPRSIPSLNVPGHPKPGTRILGVHTIHISNSPEINYSFLHWFPYLHFLYIVQRFPLGGPPLTILPSPRTMKRIGSREEVEVHKYIYDGVMEKSNIWDHFPLLKTLCFERCRIPERAAERNVSSEIIVLAWENYQTYERTRVGYSYIASSS